MAKKTRKRAELELLEEDVLISNIETTTKKEWYLNYKINNQFKLNEVHNSFMEIMLYKDTKMVFVDGPAGSAKSYLAVYGALQMLLKKQVQQIVYIRSIVESASKSIGSLPGEIGDKFHPWSLPLLEKMDELVGPKISGELMKNNYNDWINNFYNQTQSKYRY
jgi:predicted ribonuclease YlaK